MFILKQCSSVILYIIYNTYDGYMMLIIYLLCIAFYLIASRELANSLRLDLVSCCRFTRWLSARDNCVWKKAVGLRDN